MRYLINNLSNINNTTIISEDSGFPKANLFSGVLVETALINTYFEIDFTTPQQIQSVGYISDGVGVTLTASNTQGGSDFTLAIDQRVHFINETYRYWRFTVTSASYVSFVHLGQSYLQLSNPKKNSVPKFEVSDSIESTSGGQIYTTLGEDIIIYSFDLIGLSELEFQTITQWWRSTDRKNLNIFIPFENSMTKYPFEPFFAKITKSENNVRDILTYDTQFEVREGK